MVRTRSCLFTAEIRGGLWNSAPVKFSRACFNLDSPPLTPSAIASCSLTIQTYSLPAPCCAFTRRVARSIQTIRQPVTFGSRVPEWPVFSQRRIRFIQATTSWEDGFDGLSRLITPEEM